MRSFVKGLVHHQPNLFSDEIGTLVNNYLDDIWFLAESAQKNKLQLLIAEYWADQLGIELNHDKRELPRVATRHLGFDIDLQFKMVFITMKHRRKIISFFDRLLSSVRKNGRIPVSQIQKMLGLQIQISTVFRVARQFITSTCDVLRKCTQFKFRFLFPRKEKELVARLVVDLKFWRRFVQSSPQSSFNFLLGRLPANTNELFSDACTSFGMGGVVLLGPANTRRQNIDGLFQQISQKEWQKTAHMRGLQPASVKINTAEFLAALITCETFASYCKGTYTSLSLDNYAAKCWFEAARCPIFPFDRCAQGSHLHLLEMSIKIKTRWIPSEENVHADICSRMQFKIRKPVHRIAGLRFHKVRPLWHNVLKFM